MAITAMTSLAVAVGGHSFIQRRRSKCRAPDKMGGCKCFYLDFSFSFFPTSLGFNLGVYTE